MNAASLAFVCALLGAAAIAPASFAQTSTGPAQTPPEASPSPSAPDTSARTGTQAQRDWRQDGRTGWSSSREDMRGGRYADEDEDDDDYAYHDKDDDMPGGEQGMMGMHQSKSSMQPGMGSRVTSDMKRMHMRMMGAHARGANLRLKRGDSEIRIRCPSNETIAACVDAVSKLMDRVQAMPQTPR